MMKQIFLIEDDPIMQECLTRTINKSTYEIQIHSFSNVVDAIAALNQTLPDLIFLDILLNGPDGFSFLNELISYPDTNDIPIILVTSLKLLPAQLAPYHIVSVLQKETMLPQDIIRLTNEVLQDA